MQGARKTRFITRYTAGDILLAQLPFTSEASRKIRPVLVMLNTGDDDVTVAPITTSPAAVPEAISLKRYRQAGLVKPSTVRLHKITTIYKERLLARLGRLAPADFDEVARTFSRTFVMWRAD